MRNWIDEWSTLLGIVLMVFLAATAAYIKEYEKSTVEWTKKKHIMTWFFKHIYAGFSAMLVWYGAQAAVYWGVKVPEPLVIFITGVAAYAGAQFVEWLFSFGTRLAEKRAGVDTKEQKP